MKKNDSLEMNARPDPDALLKEAEREESKRGRLKIFLGYAPGVGKTYTMLQEAHVLKNRGEDIVAGIVETHKRAETEALLADLEIIPRRRVPYENIVLEEFDIDAVLARRPSIVLLTSLPIRTPPVADIPSGIRMWRNFLKAE
jgi:two-component system sensor histidine kinase KdpD